MFNAYRVNTLRYDPLRCRSCGRCTEVCPHGVFSKDDDTRVAQLVNQEACMECGACQLNCTGSAIAVDSGVGCATAMILAALTGRREPSCGCS